MDVLAYYKNRSDYYNIMRILRPKYIQYSLTDEFEGHNKIKKYVLIHWINFPIYKELKKNKIKIEKSPYEYGIQIRYRNNTRAKKIIINYLKKYKYNFNFSECDFDITLDYLYVYNPDIKLLNKLNELNIDFS